MTPVADDTAPTAVIPWNTSHVDGQPSPTVRVSTPSAGSNSRRGFLSTGQRRQRFRPSGQPPRSSPRQHFLIRHVAVDQRHIRDLIVPDQLQVPPKSRRGGGPRPQHRECRDDTSSATLRSIAQRASLISLQRRSPLKAADAPPARREGWDLAAAQCRKSQPFTAAISSIRASHYSPPVTNHKAPLAVCKTLATSSFCRRCVTWP